MQKIYSKTDPKLLLHQINRLEDIPKGKMQLSDPKEFLQICTMDLQKDETVPAHKHLWKNGEKSVITQESWIVIRGSIQGAFYDTDDKVIAEEILRPGDCVITYQGGHSLTNLEEGTIFYEIKTGPYQGRENDKVKI
ncbi:WbuC family cupin fold metalloprotein [Patescibacteria group bacterium]|nr:WbuC family cupin fold metalloprotein [Patescibacteria group bacterium]